MATADYLTVSMENLFSFKCPIFDTEVQMRSCILVRDKVYSGQRLETRRGCQACIRASKCPAADIVRRIAFGTQDATDYCSSREAKTGRLPADVLEKIAPVIVSTTIMNEHGLSSKESEMIASCGPRIEAMIATAPRNSKSEPRMVHAAGTATPKKRKAVSPGSSSTVAAATSGDLAAAINTAA